MIIIALTIIKLCLLIFLGWFLYRIKAMDEKALSFLSFFVVTISVPCLFFSRVVDNAAVVASSNLWLFLGLSLVLFIAGCLFGLFFWPKPKVLRPEILSLLAFQNSGYLPMSLAAFLFTGANKNEFLIYVVLYLLGYNVLLWSIGMFLIFYKKGQIFSLKLLFNPPVVSTLIGLFAVYLKVSGYIPGVVLDPVRMLGDMTFALSMIVLGGCLAQLTSDQMRQNMRLSLGVSLVKLAFLPLVFFLVIWHWQIYSLIGLFIILQAAMPSAVTIPVAIDAQKISADKPFISQVVLVSHLAAMISLPFWLWMFLKVSGLKV